MAFAGYLHFNICIYEYIVLIVPTRVPNLRHLHETRVCMFVIPTSVLSLYSLGGRTSVLYSRFSLSHLRLSRIIAYLEVKIFFNVEIKQKVTKYWGNFSSFLQYFQISLTSGVKVHIHFWNRVVWFILSSILQIWYVEVQISGSSLESPLDFEIITKTCLYKVDTLKPHFYIVKLGFTGVYIIFLISAQKAPTVYVLSRNVKNIRIFYPKIFIFLGGKIFSIFE